MPKAVVVGAGIVGLSSAWHLQKRGWEVTIVSPQEPQSQGCSFGNGGLIVPSHFVPLASPGLLKTGLKLMLRPKGPFGFSSLLDFKTLSWAFKFLLSAKKSHVEAASPLIRDLNLIGRREHKLLVEELGADCGYRQDGLTMVCLDSHAWEEEREFGESAIKMGLGVDFLTPADLTKIEPTFTPNLQGGVRFKDDGQVDPLDMMVRLASALKEKGVQFVTSTVKAVRLEGGKARAISTANGQEIQADAFVLAAGVWSREVGSSLGITLPLLAGKGYGVNLWDEARPSIPAILVEARVAVTPFADRTRFVGTMELGPNKLTINQARLAGMEEAIRRFYPGLGALDITPEGKKDEAWVGLRPCAPDGLPYLGALPTAQNLVVAAGHGMMGMSMGPVTGLIVSQLLSQESPELDLSLLSPTRHA